MVTIPVDDRVRIVSFEIPHAEELFTLVDTNRSHLRAWLPWVDGTKSADDTREFIKMGLKQHEAQDGFHSGIWQDQQLIGVIGLHYIDRRNRKASLGYWIGKGFEGKGIMTRACRAMISYLFLKESMNRVEISCAVENRRSRSIPARIGCKEEGIRRQVEWLYDRFVDHVPYSILAHEWTERIPAEE